MTGNSLSLEGFLFTADHLKIGKSLCCETLGSYKSLIYELRELHF